MNGREAEKDLVQLMGRYQAGSLEAFEALFLRLEPRLFGYLLSKTLNRAVAEDLLQESFLQIHRSRRTYQPGRPVLPWAFAIARHVYLMDRRRRKRSIEPVDEPESILLVISDTHNFDTLTIQRDLLAKALGKLSEEKREAVIMHHVWGLSFREIAAVLDVRKTTAKVRAFRGLQEIHRELERLGVTKTQESTK